MNPTWEPQEVLTSDSQLGEYDTFIKPLKVCQYIEFVGWYGFHPVFTLSQDSTVTQVRSYIQSQLDSGAFSSTGRCMYLVADTDKPTTDTIQLILKVEDWNSDCIPNSIENNERRRSEYISNREDEMLSNITDRIPKDSFVALNRHVESGGKYGQFQFLAIC